MIDYKSTCCLTQSVTFTRDSWAGWLAAVPMGISPTLNPRQPHAGVAGRAIFAAHETLVTQAVQFRQYTVIVQFTGIGFVAKWY